MRCALGLRSTPSCWECKPSIGTLEVGKFADVIAIPGDPTQNIRQTEKVIFAMKDGVAYRNDGRK
jgi:imidazolonepropionase-like amidohydrolase